MLSFLRELFFPDRCVGCGSWGRALCERCLSKIGGFKLYGEVYAFGFYEGVLKELIYKAKFESYSEPLKELLFFFKEDIYPLKDKVDLIVPVPEDPLRRRIFNHVSFLAELLSLILDRALSISLIKVFPTPPQVGLEKREREKNLKGVFLAKESFHEKKVLLVDDVTTTGSTLRECSKALYNAGAFKVYKLVIAVNP
ncbi:MAG: ComF family protein [Synergistetes bacterium]|nr:ComF family protein [Synergistota bacterium]MDW8191946.1 ComF family protein [Synergistota bacterium]